MGRGARRHRRADPQGDRRGPPARADVPRRPAGRGRLRQPRAAGVGRRRAQQPHQRLLVVGAARALSLDAAPIGRRPTTRTRRRSCCCRRTSRSGHYFNPHAQRIIEGKSQRRARSSCIDPRLSNTSAKADLWLPAYPGTEGALLLAIARDPARRGAATTASSCASWVNWRRRTSRPSGRTCRETFDAFDRRAEGAVRAVHAGVRRGGDRRRRGDRSSRRRDAIGRAGTAFSTHSWRAAAAGQPLGLADHALPLPARRADRIARRRSAA